MAWVILTGAGLVEIVMAIALKYANGWTRFWPSVIGVVAALASVFLLTAAVKNLPVLCCPRRANRALILAVKNLTEVSSLDGLCAWTIAARSPERSSHLNCVYLRRP